MTDNINNIISFYKNSPNTINSMNEDNIALSERAFYLEYLLERDCVVEFVTLAATLGYDNPLSVYKFFMSVDNEYYRDLLPMIEDAFDLYDYSG